jgi:hypothetical protein
MKQKNNDLFALNLAPAIVLLCGVVFCLTAARVPLLAGTVLRVQRKDSPQGVAAAVARNPAVATFEEGVKEYAKLREGVEEKLPKLHKESTPEQIAAHKTAFEEAVRIARTGAKPGNLFTPGVAAHIRATIKNEFKGAERRELREEVLDADTKGVPLRVNYPYPEAKELTQIPPTLLLKLPQLPKQVRYRFVGQHLLLVDRENGLIIDYMLNALP